MDNQQPASSHLSFTGFVTNLAGDGSLYGFITDDIFFQQAIVAGGPAGIGDQVFVECERSDKLPFKWHATTVKIINKAPPGQQHRYIDPYQAVSERQQPQQQQQKQQVVQEEQQQQQQGRGVVVTYQQQRQQPRQTMTNDVEQRDEATTRQHQQESDLTTARLVVDQTNNNPGEEYFEVPGKEEIAEEYYEDEEEDETSEQMAELANLSRQSMMPLHELIAYYQYIQQGDDDRVAKETVSRQSSCTSQQTTKTRRSLTDETDDGLSTGAATNCDVINEANETSVICEPKDLEQAADEPAVTKINVPEVQVESAGSSDELGKELPVQVSASKDKKRIRANVILELINSERDFVKHLRDVVEGYLCPARRHPEIFTGERINTIFSNIEQLYTFQRKFLESLESCINWDDLTSSNVGQCFLEYENGFSVYHHYCNNHPNATSELQDLYTKPRFVKFFEACRLLQNMIDISLDGFLLTPIQKICKYPLQLNELLKNTDEDHPDFHHVANALESMRNCANLANERKRRIEALADVMSLQEKVENWFGPKLFDTSSILIHSGEVSKMTSHTWSQGVQLYLFDHLLLYCKKDLLKRNSLILKGRICMDTVTEISDADEYKAKKSFKLYCSEQEKWFVFTTRSEKEKDEWIRAFERERNLVESDENEGFHITDKEIGVARRALQNRKHSRSARYRHKRPDTAIVDSLDIEDANSIMNRTLSLPSCIHPSYVMNFVEDSKVISSNKKNSSPSSSSRSPNSSVQYLAEQENQQSAGNWFKKMGSKKLAKSQVYNINGAGSGLSSKPHAVSPTSIVNDSISSGMKYDQLEKRHRDHMVSEEQARLFRLNNDLPPSFATSPTSTKSMISSQSNTRQANFPGSVSSSHQHNNNQVMATKRSSISNTAMATNPAGLDIQSLNLNQDLKTTSHQGQTSGSSNETTFETTIVLSSGRVVRVREDTV